MEQEMDYEEDLDDIDFNNYKGVFFEDEPRRKYQDEITGAHFEYFDMCRKLKALQSQFVETEADQVPPEPDKRPRVLKQITELVKRSKEKQSRNMVLQQGLMTGTNRPNGLDKKDSLKAFSTSQDIGKKPINIMSDPKRYHETIERIFKINKQTRNIPKCTTMQTREGITLPLHLSRNNVGKLVINTMNKTEEADRKSFSRKYPHLTQSMIGGSSRNTTQHMTQSTNKNSTIRTSELLRSVVGKGSVKRSRNTTGLGSKTTAKEAGKHLSNLRNTVKKMYGDGCYATVGPDAVPRKKASADTLRDKATKSVKKQKIIRDKITLTKYSSSLVQPAAQKPHILISHIKK